MFSILKWFYNNLKSQLHSFPGTNNCKDFTCQGICINTKKKAVCMCDYGIYALADGSCPVRFILNPVFFV